MKNFLLSTVFLVPLFAASGETLPFEFRAGKFANLYYQVNVLSGQWQGSSNAYRELWDSTIRTSTEDKAMMDKWAATLSRYSEQIDLNKHLSEKLQYPLNFPSYFEPVQKIHLAGLGAEDENDFRQRLELVVSPVDIDKLAEVMQYFMPRFETWWQKEGEAPLLAIADSMRAITREYGLQEFSAKVMHFYGGAVPKGQKMVFNLLARPLTSAEKSTRKPHTSGTVIDNVSLVEVLDYENPKERMDVVLHELFHYFYSSIPADRHAAIQNAFFSSGIAAHGAHYAYMNEVFATAFGNGMVSKMLYDPVKFEKYKDIPMSFYANEYIDATAKAMMDTLSHLLNTGYQLAPDFAKWYTPIADKALMGKSDSPHYLLVGRYMMAWGAGMTSLRNRFNQRVRAVSISSNGPDDSDWELDVKPSMPAVFFVSYDKLAVLNRKPDIFSKNVRKELAVQAKKSKAFVYCFSSTGPRYIIAGKTAEDAEQAMNAFIDANKHCPGACHMVK